MKTFPLKIVFGHIPYCLNTPLVFSLAIELVSSLQLIFIILEASFAKEDYDTAPILVFVKDFSSYGGELNSQILQDSKLMDTAQTLWIIFVIYFVLHILLLVVCLILSKRLVNKKKNPLFKAMAALYLAHSKIVFFMAHYFFMSLIGSYTDCHEAMRSSFYCQTGWLAITVLLCIANFCLALTIEMSIYQITKGKNTYAIKNNRFHQTILIHKSLAVLLYFVIGGSTVMAKTSSAINLVLSSIELIILFWKLPFYNLSLLKAGIATTIIVISSSFISLLKACGVDSQASDPIWVALTLLSLKLGSSYFNILSENILTGQFTSPEAAIFFVTKLKQYEYGYIPNYVFKDKIAEGTIAARSLLKKENFHNMIIEENNHGIQDCKVNIYTFIMGKLNRILQKNPTSEILLLYMARIEMNKLNNIPNTLKYIRKAKAISLCMSAKGALEEIVRKIKKMSKADSFDDSKDQRRFRGYFKSRKMAIALQKKIVSEVNKHLKFWDDLKKDTINIKQLADLAYEIDTTSKEIEKEYQGHLAEYRRHFVSTLLMHGMYSAIIYEDARNPKKVLQTFLTIAETLSQDHTYFNIYSEDTALLTLSLEKANRGRILDASASTQLLFGCHESQIIGYDFAKLLPSIIGTELHNLINEYVDSPNQNFNHHFTKKYGKTQTGEFFETEIHLQLYHKIEDEVKLLVFFRKISPLKALFIVNSNDIIQECSECLKRIFKLKNIEHGHMKLQNLCPNFNTLNSAVNKKYNRAESLTYQVESEDDMKNTEKETNEDMALNLPISNYTGSNKTRQPLQTVKASQEIPVIEEKVNEIQDQSSEQSIAEPSYAVTQEKSTEVFQKSMEGQYLNFFGLGTPHNSRHENKYKVEIVPYEIRNQIYKIVILSENSAIQSAYDNMKSKVMTDPNEGSTTRDKNNSTGHIQIDQKEFDSHNPIKVQLKVHKSENKRNIKRLGDGTPLFAKQNQNRGNSSIGSSTSGFVHRVKRLRGMFDQQSSYTLLRKALCILYIIMIVILFLGGANYLVTQSAIKEIQTNFQIVDLANLRLASAMESWQSATRLFLRYSKLRTGGIQTLQNNIYDQSISMLQTNLNFSKALSSDIRHNLLMEIFQKNTSLWEINQTQILNGEYVDTFVATNYLAQKMLDVAIASDVWTSVIIEEVRYVLNNTGNDYLLSSEGIIGDTEDILQTSIQDNVSTQKYLLVGESLVIFMLCLLIVIVAFLILQAYRKLFKALVKIEDSYIQNRGQQIQRLKEVLNENIETSKFKFNALELFDTMKTKQIVKTDKIKALNLMQEPKLAIKQMIFFLARFALISFIFIQIFIVLFAVSQTQSLATFNNIDQARDQLSLTAQGKYKISEVLCAFYMDMVFRGNSIMLVRNEDTALQMTKTLAELYEINRNIESSFAENGNYPSNSTIKDILYDSVCPYVPAETKAYCANATEGGNMGFFRVNQKLLSILSYYIPVYLNDPTWNTANIIMGPYADISRPCTETVQAGYDFLLSNIMYEVSGYISDFHTQQNALYIGLLVAIIICTAVIQFVTFRKFELLHNGRGKVLKVLSTEMLLESKTISFYLNRRFLNKFR